MSALTRFLGDSPLRILIKLVVVSFIVGLVMRTFGWSPWDVVEGVRDFFLDIWHLGFQAFGRFADYILLGAVIVIPAFLLIRIASWRR